MIQQKRFHKHFHGFPGRIWCACCKVKRPGWKPAFRAGRKQLDRTVRKIESMEMNDE